ncbi:hypothetical protein EV699_12361 [Plasticicumulans lactativorans]|uniref:Type 1 pili tip component n=2 Tax=Plasticicumulans lactativorans TaxID=1133106 RepID=A0A4R2KW51_9GAMM|nr:hypothetical protein EV699_12361 [Plasticicumulans lactativorans]
MDIRELLHRWQASGADQAPAEKMVVHLSLHDVARVAALADLFPTKTPAAIAAELLSAALDQVEAAFPYVQGQRVIAEDEQGDPIYEDAGLTPRFIDLTKQHSNRLRASRQAGA